MSTTKIQSGTVATRSLVASETTQSVSAESKGAVSKVAAGLVANDKFEGITEGGCYPRPRCPPYPIPFPPPGPGGQVTLNKHDILVGSHLRDTLSSPWNDLRLAFGKQNQQLSRGKDGVMRGPEGQPLVQVKLKDGNTAYVDPNTNQYYLTNHQERFGRVNAMGPLKLPANAQFSNSYFSDADCKALERYARGGGIFPPPPVPVPLPFPGPRPLPVDIQPVGIKPLPLEIKPE